MVNHQYLNRLRYPLAACVFAAFLCEAADQTVYLLAGPTDSYDRPKVIRLLTLSGSGNGLSLVQTVSGSQPEESTCSVSIDPDERLVAVLADLYTEAVVTSIYMDHPGQLRKALIHFG